MDEQIIAIYCLCDDFIKSKKIKDWPNVKITTSEVMISHIVALKFFYGNLDRARKFFVSMDT